MIKHLTFILCIFILNSCTAQSDKTSNKKVRNKRTEKQIAYFKSKNIEVVENMETVTKDQYELCIMDSIVVKMDSVRFYYYDFSLMKKNNVIFAQGGRSAGYLMSGNGTVLHKIGNIGSAPGEYNTCRFKLVHNIDSVFIAFDSNILLYNKDGNFVRSWKFKNVRLGITFGDRLFASKNNKNELIISARAGSKDYSEMTEEFYEKTFLMASLNLVTEETTTALQYEPESPYKQGLSYFYPTSACITQKNKDEWTATFIVDELIYIYDKNLKLTKVINPNSDNFPEPQGVKLIDDQKDYINNWYKYAIRLNASNKSTSTFFTEKEGYLVRYYSLPIGDGANTPKNTNDFDASAFVQDRKLQIFTKEGKKYCPEILLPKKVNNLQYAESLDKMYFTSNEKLVENNVIYIAKLCKK